jgi:hypothetical protein
MSNTDELGADGYQGGGRLQGREYAQRRNDMELPRRYDKRTDCHSARGHTWHRCQVQDGGRKPSAVLSVSGELPAAQISLVCCWRMVLMSTWHTARTNPISSITQPQISFACWSRDPNCATSYGNAFTVCCGEGISTLLSCCSTLASTSRTSRRDGSIAHRWTGGTSLQPSDPLPKAYAYVSYEKQLAKEIPERRRLLKLVDVDWGEGHNNAIAIFYTEGLLAAAPKATQ